MRKIKILYIIDELELGGTQRQLSYLCTGLDKNRFQIVLCYLTSEEDMLEMFEPHCKKIVKILKKPGFDLFLLFKLKKLMLEEGIDIVHTCLFTADFWGQIAAILAGKKRVSSKRSEHGYGFVRDKIMAVIDRLTHCVTANSQAGKQHFSMVEWLPKDKIILVENGINHNDILNTQTIDLRQEYDIPENAIIIGTVARLIPVKNIRLFLDIIKRVSDHESNVRAIIVGDGEEREMLEARAHELGVFDMVTFAGFRSNAHSYMKAFDIYLSTSKHEGFSNSILEAMAMRKIVWCTPVGNAEELIRQSVNGFILERGSINVAALLEESIANCNELSKEAYRTSCKYSAEKMVNQYHAIYHTLVE